MRLRTRAGALGLALGLLVPGVQAQDGAAVPRIAPQALWQQLQQKEAPAGFTLLDVRTPEEFAEGHVPGAVNIPLAALASRIEEIPARTPVVVYCRSGRRTQSAIPLLRERGHAVTELDGSMLAWRAAGLPEARPGAPYGVSPSGRTKVK